MIKNLFIFFLVFLTMASCRLNKEKGNSSLDISDLNDQYSSFIMNNIFEDIIHFPSEYKVIDLDGKLIHLKSLLKTSKIAIRLHESYCKSCIIEQINTINSSLINPNDIVIGLATFDNIRKIKILLNKYQIKFPVYFISHNDNIALFSKINDQDYLPFYFMIDPDLKISYIFHPNIHFTTITKDYLTRCESIIKIKKNKSVDPLVFDNIDQSFNNALINKTQIIELHYQNISNVKIIIDSIDLSCDCIDIIKFDSILCPDEKGKLTLKYRPDNIGFDEKEIKFVLSNRMEIKKYLNAYVID